MPRGLYALVENNNQNNCWILAPHTYTRILSWTGICTLNIFHLTPLLPTTKDACDLSNVTTQLLVVDVACD
jgi:hypothetical protein